MAATSRQPLTDSTTNYTAPTAITVGTLTSTLNWTPFLAASSTTGPNGDSSGIGYDSAGRPASITPPIGATTTYSYSINPPQTTATVITDHRWTRTTMDGFGRTIKTEVADNNGTVNSVSDAQYAACGCSP